MVAIRNACKNLNRVDLSDCILYSSCEQCPMCASLIFWTGIKTVYYAARGKKCGFEPFIQDLLQDCNKSQKKGTKYAQKVPKYHHPYTTN